jgi:hypothetical protein
MARWLLRGVILMILGVGLLAAPVFVLDVPEQTQVVVHVDKIGGVAPSASDGSVANYRSLNGSVQSVFDAGRKSGTTRVDGQTQSGVVNHFGGTPYVKYSGGYYHIRLYERPDSYSTLGAGAIVLTMLGGFVLIWGLFTALVGAQFPFNLARSFVVPVVAILAVLLSPTDITGGTGVPPIPLAMTYFPMPVFFIGGAFANHGYLSPLFGLAILLLLLAFFVAFLLGHPLVVPFLFVGAVLAGGFPWLVLGWITKQ